MPLEILFTAATYAPYIDGVSYVIQNIAKRLVSRGHKIIVATGTHSARDFGVLNGVEVRQFDISGNRILGYQGDHQAYADFIEAFRGDILVNYAAQTWASDLVYPLLKSLRCKKIFIPCGYSGLHDKQYHSYFLEMPDVLNRYEHVVYHSAKYQDKRFGDEHAIKRYSIIPNGAREDEFLEPRSGFREAYGIKESKFFLSVGNYGAGKNQEFVLKAYLDAGIPDSCLVFIGSEFNSYSWKVLRKDPYRNGLYGKWFRYMTLAKRHGFYRLNPVHSLAGPARQGLKVRIFEKIPRAMVVAAYHEADLFLYGSLVECFPLVILEAMASVTPFISTNCGNVAELPGGIVALSTKEMTEAIRDLAGKGPAWEKLSREGRHAWERDYRWDMVVNKYETLFFRMAGS